MKVVIFCGGAGTRLKEMTEDLPKPLIQVGGKPVLWHIMKVYQARGFNEFVLCLGYKGDKIKEYFEKNPENEFKIDFVNTGDATTPKSERLQKIKEYITEENFLLAYGDDLSDVDINEVIKNHTESKNTVTITVINPRSDFGVVKIDDANKVTGFEEKPRLKNAWISGGYAVVNKDIFNYLSLGELENEVYKKLVEENKLGVFKHEGFWKTMNTFKDHCELEEMWKNNDVPWRIK